MGKHVKIIYFCVLAMLVSIVGLFYVNLRESPDFKVRRLQSNISQLENRKDLLSKEIKVLEVNLSTLKQSHATLTSHMRQLKSDVSAFRDLEPQISQLRENQRKLTAQLATVNSNITSIYSWSNQITDRFNRQLTSKQTSTQQRSYSTPSSQSTSSKALVAENSSYYGQISETTGRPKTVRVRGYYRKDGTYVRGHYRSAPRR